MHSSPGAGEKLATQTANEDIATRKKLEGNIDTDLSDFEGPAGKSPYFRSQVTSGHEGVHSGFEDSRVNSRMMGRASGFGYEQPTTMGAEDEINSQEATAHSKVERDALVNEAGMKMQAAGLRTGEMGQFNPDSSIKTAGSLEQDRLNRRMQMFATLAKLGVSGATMGMGAAGVGNFGKG